MSPQNSPVRERPALFKGEMVRAIMREVDPKEQTRRAMSARSLKFFKDAWRAGEISDFATTGKITDWDRSYIIPHCPYGKVGDRLWVKETFAANKYYDGRPGNGCGPIPEGVAIECRESPDAVRVMPGLAHRSLSDERGRWRPSIFMPRWASRLTLEITDVRVERLKEISEADAKAEGIREVGEKHGYGTDEPFTEHNTARDAYRSLWESINGPGSWAINPWVWCVSFRRLA